jgi:hypothetical protein
MSGQGGSPEDKRRAEIIADARQAIREEVREEVRRLAEAKPKNLDGLTELIAKHNPYTAGNIKDMDMYLQRDTHDNHRFGSVEIEQDGGYPGDWSFKGQPQKINKVLRIKYRAAIHEKDQYGRPTNVVSHWMTAYLLIAFEDGTGD